MLTRVKRTAAAAPPIIDLDSDSEEDVILVKPTRKKRKLDDSDYIDLDEGETIKEKKSRKTVKKDSSTIQKKTKSIEKKVATKSKTAVRKGLTSRKAAVSTEAVINPTENTKLPEQLDGGGSSCLKSASEQLDGGVTSYIRRARRNKEWEVHELLAEMESLDDTSSRNIVDLFEDDNTIPFICRYRRDMIRNDIGPEKLRDIKNTYVAILGLKKRSEVIVKTLEKDGLLNKEIESEMLSARTMDELEFLYAPYKPASKGSLADRAKALGLEKYAEDILYGNEPAVHLENIVNFANSDLDSVDKVADGICHILSHIYGKSTEVLEELRRLQKIHRIMIKCTKAKATKEKENSKDTAKKYNSKTDESKYENYFDYQNNVQYVKPHQVLAINRGEKAKILSVKIITPDRLKEDMKYFIRKQFLFQGSGYQLRNELFEKSYEECYTKKLQPLLCRQLRSDLNEAAKKASIDVFAKNLKQLLLMSPLKGECILGLDPGFSNGCKFALISKTADVLDTGVLYPHTKFGNALECGYKLSSVMKKHGCSLIALGNGTACRETELWISQLFEQRILDADKVRYSIVSEQGASVYSCGEVARKEFPKLDVNLISAVSIARRLNDPLSEYVKIEPRHIGVGMYQHDINEKILSETLNEVVTECVSFVGVDINTASLSVLKYIAGLTSSRAEKIIEHRLKNGPFKTRKDLLKVKSVGEKSFTQCAGFIRIEPLSVGETVDNLLDCTWVHPESYDIAKKIILKSNLKLNDIGQAEFIHRINNFRMSIPLIELEKEFKVPKERILSVFEALQRVLLRDYRCDIDKKPLFKQGITKMSELKKGEAVTGAVTNVTHFGAFVDIGVDTDALIHISKMNGSILNIGDRIEATVLNVDVQRSRIQLSLDDLGH